MKPPVDLDPWEAAHLDRLVELCAGTLAQVDGDTVVHLDVRADNILLGRDRVYFVDWPWACNGAPWLDTALFLVNAAYSGHDPEALAQRSVLLRDVDPIHVSGVLAGLAGMWAEASRRPPPDGLPTVREFQRAQQIVTLEWLKRRLPW